ncbi:MAG: hypothetical protein GF311_19580 [Candidatus Lokiarchaeota archaeon]|nr:hypothetical protein [Candidatus Lokiarchaeota archaeon]
MSYTLLILWEVVKNEQIKRDKKLKELLTFLLTDEELAVIILVSSHY